MKYFWCVVFLWLALPANAQYESLVNKPYKDRYKSLDSLLEASKKVKHYDTILAISKKIKDLGKRNKDKALELEGEYYAAFYYLASERYDEEEAVKGIETVIQKAEKQNVLSLQIRATYILGYYFWNAHQQYERGFRYYIKTDKLLEKTNPIDFPNWLVYYHNIAICHYYFKDYKKAFFYARKTFQVPINKDTWKIKWSIFNDMGVFYKEIKQLDSAMYYYKKALDNPFLKENDIHYIISKGNIGDIYYEKGLYNKAMPLLKMDMDGGIKYNDYNVASQSAINIANIYMHKNDYKKAKTFLDFASKHIRKKLVAHKLLIRYHKAMSTWFFNQNRLENGKTHYDSVVDFIKKKNDNYNSILLLRAQESEDLRLIESEKAKTRLLSQVHKTRILTIAIISTFIIASIFIIYLLVVKKHQRKIKQANISIQNFKKRIEEDSSVIEKLKQLKTDKSNIDIIEKIQKQYTVKNEDWDDFFIEFNILHKGYITRLKNIVPSITKNEIKVVSLAKLELNSNDMATVLSVTPQAIRTAWYRLSKKANLDKDTSLQCFASGI